MTTTTTRLLTTLPLLADGSALLLAGLFLSDWAARLGARAPRNVILFGLAYALFCAGFYLVRKLEPAAPAPDRLDQWLRSRNGRGLLGVLFALVMMLAVSHQYGYLDSLLTADPRALGEGGAVAFFAVAPGAWLAASLFYVLLLISEFEPAIARDRPAYPWLALLGLVTANGLLLLLTAEARAVLPAGGGGPLAFLLGLPLLALLFGPARLYYRQRAPGWPGLASLLVLLGYCAYRLAA